ncbi:hypothetical protein [Acidovorax kalamii]|uniref:hypothetical protein n=1 Tax=Acidovorax kalamii TaxID=2004485 RepID=UPI0020906CA7|nr:hypothetical protein [Acidovorax kalamii]MCO5354734.1 hypothetical protein [Acidovorax kalamii]
MIVTSLCMGIGVEGAFWSKAFYGQLPSPALRPEGAEAKPQHMFLLNIELGKACTHPEK